MATHPFTEFTIDELRLMLAQGHETRGVEFKPPGECSGYLLAQVVRAVLGLANRRDGGYVIVGVKEDGNGITPVGLSGDELATWNFDDVSAQINAYADPSVELELFTPEHDGKTFVVLRVAEFSSIPVLCRKDWSNQKAVLRRGACYVRSVAKPETSEVPTQTEMRELLDVATEKRLRAYFSLSAGVGLSVSDLARTAASAQFDREPGLPEGPVLTEIRLRGRWEILLHPTRYLPDRLELEALRPILERCTVKVGGWAFPMIATTPRPTLEADAILQADFRFHHYKEVWRFSTSGKFAGALGFAEDWRDESGLWPTESQWRPGAQIGIRYTLRTLLQIFEFAARLVTAVPGDDDVILQVVTHGLKGRELYVDDQRRFPFRPRQHVASSDRWSLNRQLTRSELARDSRMLARDAAKRLFAMFEFTPPVQQLEEIAQEIMPARS